MDVYVGQRMGMGRRRTCVSQITERNEDFTRNLANDRTIIT